MSFLCKTKKDYLKIGRKGWRAETTNFNPARLGKERKKGGTRGKLG